MKLTFEERRKVIQAARNFKPELAEEQKDPPLEVIIMAFLAIIGAVTIVWVLGIAIINLF